MRPCPNYITPDNIVKLVDALCTDIVRTTAIPDKLLSTATSSATEMAAALMPAVNRAADTLRGFASLFSMKVMSSPFCTVRTQSRFPRSKKKRMRKKWAKDQRNWREEPTAYLFNNKDIIAHPGIIQAIREETKL